MSFPLRSGRWTPRRAAGQLATLLALALLPATAFAYLDYFGFSTAPAALLPDECFSTYAANLSLVWPEDADPDAPSPLPGLSNAQRMAQDVLLRGAQGIKSVLHLGFVIDTRSDGALRRRYVIRWGRVFRQLHADRFVYAVIGIDDSNCSIFSAAQERAAILHRRRMTALVKYAFPAVKLRGHVLNVGGWGAPIMGSACAPLPPSDFGLRNETVVFAYDYRTDGTTACAQLGNPLPTEADANASMILADLAGMIDTLSRTKTGPRPVIFFPKAYDAFTCMAEPDNDMTIACRMADVWGRLRAEPTTGLLQSIVAVLPFAWNDIGARFYWRGIENSPRLRATMAWIAGHR